MKKFLIATTIVAAALGATTPGQAAEELAETKNYDSSAVVVSLTGGAVNIGGVRFAAPGFNPTKVVVNDATGLNVSLIAAQDLNGNNISGEASAREATATGCGTVDLSSSKFPYDPSKEIVVFVQTASAACAGQVGTTGSVDLYVDVPTA